jgi:hypothetical protein
LTWTNERAENSQRIPNGELLYRSYRLDFGGIKEGEKEI